MTKPRPDQPGRCPSIDPHDTLQCTRAIHDDDQCQAGGIAWRKGSPRIEWDRERADRLQKDVERMQKDIERLTTERDALAQIKRHIDEVRNGTGWTVQIYGVLLQQCDQYGKTIDTRRAERAEAERDALAAQVARVEEVLDHWRTVDEGNAAYAERIGERSRFADGLASRADMLRDALAGSESDTGAEEAGHRCEPYYSRAECGQCGWQEQWCATCSRQMCGCATETTDQEDQA